MILDKKEKQPVEVKDYPIDYSEWLGEVLDTIVNAEAYIVCTTDAEDVSLVVHNMVMASNGVSVWLAGGTANQKYKVSVTVTTAGGRVDQSEFIVKVKEY